MTPTPPPIDRFAPNDPEAQIGSLERIRRFDRQATLERLIAYLAHNLGSPLNVIEGRAAMMASGQVGVADVQRNARIIAEQSSRIVRFLREVVTFARRNPRSVTTLQANEATIDLGVLARAAVTMFKPMARDRRASISFEGDGGAAPIRGDADTLLVALTHVLENGIRATPAGGALTVRLRREAVPEDGQDAEGTPTLVPFFKIEVDDQGSGIETEMLSRLFEPFATTRDEQQAVGLGLFIAQSIAKEHGGWLEGANKDGTGALFTLHLPQECTHAE